MYPGSTILTEGEFDCMAYDQMGFPNAISLPNGAEAFPEESIDDLEGFGEIYLSYDMDEAGRKGVQKGADKLGRYRCFNIFLPLKDANSCLLAGFTNQEMVECLTKAKPFGSKIIKGADAYFDDVVKLYEELVAGGIKTGLRNFDDLLGGGLRLNELSELTGETGSGKTTFGANVCFRIAKAGHPVLIASFEMKPPTIIRKMVQSQAGKSLFPFDRNSFSPHFTYVASLPLFFVDTYGEMSLSALKDVVYYYAKRRHGIEVVLLDHLHFFLRYQANEERQAIDQALTSLKSWAMELNIHIILIVHPTKIETENRPIRLNDLKGSSGLKQIPDNVFSIWRERGAKEIQSPISEIVLYLLKVRDDSGDEGKLILTFDKRSQSYTDSGPVVASAAEGKGFPGLSPSSRIPAGREWVNGHNSR